MPGEPPRIEAVRLSKGKVAHLPFPFALRAVLREQRDFLYRDADLDVVRELGYPGHRKTVLDALIRETGDGTYVVRQQDATFRCRPLEHTAIVSTGQPRILDSNDVEVVSSPQQGADDVVIEVLVRSRGRALLRIPLAPTSEKAGTHTNGIEAQLIACPHGLIPRPPASQVFLDLRRATHIVRDDLIDVGQTKRWKLLRNFLRRGPGDESCK